MLTQRVAPRPIRQSPDVPPTAISNVVEYREDHGLCGPFILCYLYTKPGAAEEWGGGGYCVQDVRDWTVWQFGREAEEGLNAAKEWREKENSKLPNEVSLDWEDYVSSRIGIDHRRDGRTRRSTRRADRIGR
jgi:hypothetical protein